MKKVVKQVVTSKEEEVDELQDEDNEVSIDEQLVSAMKGQST